MFTKFSDMHGGLRLGYVRKPWQVVSGCAFICSCVALKAAKISFCCALATLAAACAAFSLMRRQCLSVAYEPAVIQCDE